MTREVKACPECDHAPVIHRVTFEASRRWRCTECGGEFREPNVRPAKREGTTDPHGAIGRKLLDMDPDDLPSKDGDGGDSP